MTQRIGNIRRIALGFTLIALAAPSVAQQSTASGTACYCLDNFAEVRFLWNCRDDATKPGRAICSRPEPDGAVAETQVELTDDWDRYEAGTAQCPSNCLPPDVCSGGAIRGELCPK